jgi:hypothetical protein
MLTDKELEYYPEQECTYDAEYKAQFEGIFNHGDIILECQPLINSSIFSSS